jgi:hypothetical protein
LEREVRRLSAQKHKEELDVKKKKKKKKKKNIAHQDLERHRAKSRREGKPEEDSPDDEGEDNGDNDGEDIEGMVARLELLLQPLPRANTPSV